MSANSKMSFPLHASRLQETSSTLSDLPEHLQHRTPRLTGDEDWQPLALDEVRKIHIQKVLQMCNGNRLRAAQIIGIGRTSLYRYLKRDGCDTPVRTHMNSAAAYTIDTNRDSAARNCSSLPRLMMSLDL